MAKKRTEEPTVTSKVCNGPLCKGKEHPAANFYKNPCNTTGLNHQCKDCCKLRSKNVGSRRKSVVKYIDELKAETAAYKDDKTFHEALRRLTRIEIIITNLSAHVKGGGPIE